MLAFIFQLIEFMYKRDTSILSATMLSFMFLFYQWFIMVNNKVIPCIQSEMLCTS